jgi:chemotaxis protein histidine kinase CheA
MNPSEFLGEFQAEAGEKLDLINSQLLRLERDATNPQPIREMFLAAHTVKGGAAMLRLTDIEYLAHALEDRLSSIRDRQNALDAPAADLLFKAIDLLRGLVAGASIDSVGADPNPGVQEFAERLRSGDGERASFVGAPAPAAVAKRALVVDDSMTVRALCCLLLQEAGFAVEEAEDGNAALSLALEDPFSVIVAGVQTRGLTGMELASALRRAPAYAEVPIILMSSDADAASSRRAVEAGAQVLLRKTSLADERLTETVAALLRKRAA